MEDRAWVERELLGLISSVGLEPWFGETDINSTEEWERSILEALVQSQWFILVMSPRAAASDWVKDELHWAIGNRNDYIIPLLVEDCDRSDFHLRLSRIQYIDFRHEKREAREELVKLLVKREYLESDDAATFYPGIEAIIQASDLPMYFTDNDSIVRFVNKRLTTLLGLKATELTGRSVSVLVDRFVSFASEERQVELRRKQDFFLQHGLPDHAEEDDLIDLRHLIGNRYQGIQRVWISADRIYNPNTEMPIGVFFVYRPQLVEK